MSLFSFIQIIYYSVGVSSTDFSFLTFFSLVSLQFLFSQQSFTQFSFLKQQFLVNHFHIFNQIVQLKTLIVVSLTVSQDVIEYTQIRAVVQNPRMKPRIYKSLNKNHHTNNRVVMINHINGTQTIVIVEVKTL